MSNLNMSNPFLALIAPLNKNTIKVQIGAKQIDALVDTGASISCISQQFLQKCLKNVKIDKTVQNNIMTACGTRYPVVGKVEIKLNVNELILYQEMTVLENLAYNVILGIDFLSSNKVNICFENNTLSIQDNFLDVPLNNVETVEHFEYVKSIDSIEIPPHSEMNIPVKVRNSRCNTLLFEPNLPHSARNTVGSKVVVNLINSKTMYRVLNPTSSAVKIKKHVTVAKGYEIDKNCIFALEESETFVKNMDTTNSAQMISELGIKINDNLCQTQRDKLIQLLIRNRNVFAKDLSELGKTNLHYHRIDTGDAAPVRSAPYRQTPELRKETEKQIQQMIDSNIIEPSTSQWSSPIVLVAKKTKDRDGNKQYRFAIDYRKLNKVTVPTSFPIPRIDDVFDTVADSKASIFTVLDLMSGFLQTPLDPQTKHKTAFVTHQGVYQFKRLSFGLMNAPMAYQMLMTKVLRELNWKIALVYIDDILIFSNNFEEHLKHLELVFDKLKQANLTLNPSKCHFAKEEVTYLGHILSKSGIQVNPEKISAVSTFPVPKNVKQIRSFLGLCNYYRKFVQDYAKISVPLTQLTHKNSKFTWTPECQTAFDTLKQKLVSAPILTFPNFNKPFVLSVDASDYAIGYVLGQLSPTSNLEYVVAYGGRNLKSNEQKWHINEKEGLALKEAILHFKPYLSTSKFKVYTDNITVRWLESIKNAQGRLGRWALELQGYILR